MPTRRELANAVRALSMDAIQQANSGHPGAPMGMADIAEVLWNDFLKHSPGNPDWWDRDRFVLSNGHGSMLLYSLLHLTGYEDFPIEQLRNFRQMGYKTAGHPEYEPGGPIETTTGPLGQGVTNAVENVNERIAPAVEGLDGLDQETLDAIAAVVIGGTAMTGGRGRVWGTMLGVLILIMISNMLTLADVEVYWQGFVKGVIIILAVLIQRGRAN